MVNVGLCSLRNAFEKSGFWVIVFCVTHCFTTDMWLERSLLNPVTAPQSLQTATTTKRSALLSRTRRLGRVAPKTSYSTTARRSVESTLKASAWSRPTTTPTRCGPLAVTWWLWTTRPQVKLPTFLLLLSEHQSNVATQHWRDSPCVFTHISAGGAKDWGAEKSVDQQDSDAEESPGRSLFTPCERNRIWLLRATHSEPLLEKTAAARRVF